MFGQGPPGALYGQGPSAAHVYAQGPSGSHMYGHGSGGPSGSQMQGVGLAGFQMFGKGVAPGTVPLQAMSSASTVSSPISVISESLAVVEDDTSYTDN